MTKRVVIIGAGAHGREVAEILIHRERAGDGLSPLGFVDDNGELRGGVIDGLPVLGDWSWFDGVDRDEIAVVCASGFSETRRRMVERAALLGLSFADAVSPLAHVSPRATLGEGVVIYAHGVVCTGASVGDHSVVNVGAVVSHDTLLGRYGTLNPCVGLAGNVTIGEGCYLGIGCSVIQGISIGEWTTVGAGAAVIRDLPARVTAVGVPARILKTREESE